MVEKMRCQECETEMLKFKFCYVCPKCGEKNDPDELYDSSHTTKNPHEVHEVHENEE